MLKRLRMAITDSELRGQLSRRPSNSRRRATLCSSRGTGCSVRARLWLGNDIS